MRKTLLLLTFSCIVLNSILAQIPDNSIASYSIPQGLIADKDFVPGKLVCKIKNPNDWNQPLLQKIKQDFQIQTPTLFFPLAEKPNREFDIIGRKYADLTQIYILDFPSHISIYELSKLLNNTQLFDYVQPKFIFDSFRDQSTQLIPNDVDFTNQWYLQKINAPLAWDTYAGDTNTVVAIVDGGQNWSNPDIQNYDINYADPIDGIDNDGDGYIDNLVGWNTGDNNYDVTAYCGSCIHGTSVAGVAAGKGNNSVGIAGVGFNIKFVPIKIANSSGQWVGGEAGIFYAAYKNLKIINCSWGSIYYNPVLNDVVQYATINKSALVISASGNGLPTPQTKSYPAALENVIAVTGTNPSDEKLGSTTTGSSYYKEVDISAPAENIYTAYGNSFMSVGNGTSYAAPMVSGAAALISGGLPGITSLQIEAILKQKSFNNTLLPANANYWGKIGKGRLDINAALTSLTYGPYFHFNQRNYSSNNGTTFGIGDTVFLTGNMFNVLEMSSANTIGKLRTNSPFIQLVDSTFQIGAIPIFSSINNQSNPYRFIILPNCPENEIIEFEWVWEDGSYHNVQHFSMIVNQSFLNVTINNLHTSIGYRGRIGYMNEDANVGLGMQSNTGFQHMLAGSFLIGKNSSIVSDASFSTAVVPFDNDFQTLQSLQIDSTSSSQFQARGAFTDAALGTNGVGVNVYQKINAYNEYKKQNFIILNYEIQNITNDTLHSIYAGLNSYWNILNSQYFDYSSIATYDSIRKLAYAYNPMNNSKYAGIRLLSMDPATHYAFNFNGAGGSISMQDGFSSQEKWDALSGNLTRKTSIAGQSSSLIGTGPLHIQPQGTANISFALIIGDDLASLQESADTAYQVYLSSWNQWTGMVSSNWHQASNWSLQQIPDSSQSIYIKSGTPHAPKIQQLAHGKNLFLDTTTTLVIENNGALKISKQSTINGHFIIENSGQFIQGNESNLTGSGIMENQKFSIQNSPLYYASSVPSNSLIQLTQNISSGIAANSFATNDSMAYLPSSCVQFSPQSNSPNSAILEFKNTQSASCFNDGFLVRSLGNIVAGSGQIISILSSDSIKQIGFTNNKWGQILLNQSLTSAKYGHYIGNPFPSNVSFTHFRQLNPHISNGAIIKDGNQIKIINPYTQPYIKNGNGFWIEVDSNQTQSQILFNNNIRISGLNYDTVTKNTYNAAYQIAFKSPSNISSEALIVHDINAHVGFEYGEDFRLSQIGKEHPEIRIKNTDGKLYSLNSIPQIQSGMIFPLDVKSTENGNFEIKGIKLGTGNDHLWAALYDQTLQNIKGAEDGSSYTVALNGIQDSSRFSIRFYTKPNFIGQNGICGGSGNSISINNPSQIAFQYALIDLSTLDTVLKSTSSTPSDIISNINTGSYTLHYGISTYTDSENFTLATSSSVQASFQAPSTGLVNMAITFTQTSIGHSSQLWSFGDGVLSTSSNPTHSYLNSGIYTVRLISQNNQCSDTAYQNILIQPVSYESHEESLWKIWQNGTTIWVDNTGKNEHVQLMLLDLSGKILYTDRRELHPGQNEVGIGILAPGLYLIKIQGTENQITKKLHLGFGN